MRRAEINSDMNMLECCFVKQIFCTEQARYKTVCMYYLKFLVYQVGIKVAKSAVLTFRTPFFIQWNPRLQIPKKPTRVNSSIPPGWNTKKLYSTRMEYQISLQYSKAKVSELKSQFLLCNLMDQGPSKISHLQLKFGTILNEYLSKFK